MVDHATACIFSIGSKNDTHKHNKIEKAEPPITASNVLFITSILWVSKTKRMTIRGKTQEAK